MFLPSIRNLLNFSGLILFCCLYLHSAVSLSAESAVPNDAGVPVSQAKHKETLKLVNYLIGKSHYRSISLDDQFSQKVLEEFVGQLDPARIFFLSEDIEQIDQFRTLLDDFIRKGDLEPAFLIFRIYRERVRQGVEYAIHRLQQPFDFSIDEEFVLDRSDSSWPDNQDELKDLWRRRIKNDILGLLLTGKEMDEIVETLESRYTHLDRRSRQFKSDDVFQMFINAYVNTVEPHTSYYSPRATENFKINMRLSLEGIGAVLQTDNEYTKVRRVVPGGPADLGGELQAEDRIVGVGQGDEKIVDVIGWRLDDVVNLIRGPKNSTVKLEIIPGDSGLHGETRTISIVRDQIRLEEQAAKKKVLEVSTEDSELTRIGLIQLPSFYIDFDALHRGDPEYKSTTRDVRRLLDELNRENIDGLVIDLRGNGGGSLRESIALTGLFIEKGPVVQVQNSHGRLDIDRDPDPEILYDGPLAVLVDGYSASASEIFAGAIQDYRRGIIIGHPTFGKGTVQNMLNLNRFHNKQYDLGQLKLTIAQFFRINGESTQFRGVEPDIQLIPTDLEIGERSFDNAIPWRQIKGVAFNPFDDEEEVHKMVLDLTREAHLKRVSDDPELGYHSELSRISQEQREIKRVSLHEEIRRTNRELLDDQRLELENIRRSALGENSIDSIQVLDMIQEEREQQAVSEIEPDFFVRESARILSDFVHFSQDRGSKDQYLVKRHSEQPTGN